MCDVANVVIQIDSSISSLVGMMCVGRGGIGSSAMDMEGVDLRCWRPDLGTRVGHLPGDCDGIKPV